MILILFGEHVIKKLCSFNLVERKASKYHVREKFKAMQKWNWTHWYSAFCVLQPFGMNQHSVSVSLLLVSFLTISVVLLFKCLTLLNMQTHMFKCYVKQEQLKTSRNSLIENAYLVFRKVRRMVCWQALEKYSLSLVCKQCFPVWWSMHGERGEMCLTYGWYTQLEEAAAAGYN